MQARHDKKARQKRAKQKGRLQGIICQRCRLRKMNGRDFDDGQKTSSISLVKLAMDFDALHGVKAVSPALTPLDIAAGAQGACEPCSHVQSQRAARLVSLTQVYLTISGMPGNLGEHAVQQLFRACMPAVFHQKKGILKPCVHPCAISVNRAARANKQAGPSYAEVSGFCSTCWCSNAHF